MEFFKKNENRIEDSKSDTEVPNKLFIKSRISLYDSTQIETTFDYKLQLDREHDFFLKKNQKFEVKAYFFFPAQMNVNSQTYTKNDFYQDLNPLVRLREPRYSFKEFFGISKNSILSPIERMKVLLDHYKKQRGKHVSEKMLIDQARIFACSYGVYFEKRISRKCKKLSNYRKKESLSSEDIEKRNAAFVESCDSLLKRGRKILLEWQNIVNTHFQSEEHPDSLKHEINLVNEYCFYCFREGLARLSQALLSCEYIVNARKGSLERSLRVWARWLSWYSDRKNYIRLEAKSILEEKEGFAFRFTFLKKHMEQVLFLDMKPRPGFTLQRQIAPMLAAGIAALWAFAANFLIWYEFQFGGFSFSNGENLLGLSGLMVVFAFTLAYILKDRIKELGRNRFGKGFFRQLPDFSEKIWVPGGTDRKINIGYVQEWMKFLELETAPDSVKELRKFHSQVELDREKTIYYRKTIELDEKRIRKQDLPFTSVRDIIRFDLKRHLNKLGKPVLDYLSLEHDGSIVSFKIPRVFHVDIAIKYLFQNPDSLLTQSRTEYYRLFLHKDGLIRIENKSAELAAN